MTNAQYKISSVSIEGFKAFTFPQEIEIGERHAFFFGKNGSGKSSILEAIRWCLFGQMGRPEAEVRNAYYPKSQCRVQLVLRSLADRLVLVRELRPGGTRSDMTITTSAGKEIDKAEIFPHLARIAPREGTHIIFAAQESTGRRPHADISNFEGVLYSYLGVEDIPEVISRIDTIVALEREEMQKLGQEISEVEAILQQKYQHLEAEQTGIVRNPPWDSLAPPTEKVSREKVEAFVKQAAETLEVRFSENAILGTGDALEAVDEAHRQRTGQEASKVGQKLQTLRDRLMVVQSQLTTRRQLETVLESVEAKIVELNRSAGVVASGRTTAQINDEIRKTEEALQKQSALISLVSQAEKYCASHALQACPLCASSVSHEALLKSIRLTMGTASPQAAELTRKLDELRKENIKVTGINNQIKHLISERDHQTRELQANTQRLHEILALPPPDAINNRAVETHLDSLRKAISAQEADAGAAETTRDNWRRVLTELKRELRFQELRGELTVIQETLTRKLERVREKYKTHVEQIESAEKIKAVLELEFDLALDQALPVISQEMTDVFNRLTGQLSFNAVHVARSADSVERKLGIKVSSSRRPQSRYNPADVLNGQAYSALHLLPYFVFSKFQSEALELDMLLIDDPSQSFDTSHVELLLQELAKVGKHAQLVIATHEDERFAPHLQEQLGVDGLRIVRVHDFDPETGPSISYAESL